MEAQRGPPSFEVLVLMAVELPVVSIQRQIASAIDIVVQIERKPGGRRVVTQISEIAGFDQDRHELIVHDWLDHDYIAQHTVGWEALRERALRATHGTGGVLALATLGTHGLNGKSRTIRRAITLLAVVGLALFYGDAIITPAVSCRTSVNGSPLAFAPSIRSRLEPPPGKHAPLRLLEQEHGRQVKTGGTSRARGSRAARTRTSGRRPAAGRSPAPARWPW